MNMPSAVRSVLSQYATFTGRASRSEFWWYSLALILLVMLLSIIEGAVIAPMLGFEPFAPEAGQPLQMVAILGLLVPSIAVVVRRLHDIDRSGWWYFIGLIPVVGALVLLYWYVQPSTEGANRFGESPL